MPHPNNVIRPRVVAFPSHWIAILGSLAALLALGCKPGPAGGDRQDPIAAAAAVASPGATAPTVIGATSAAIDPASTVAATVHPPASSLGAKAAAQPTVWVILKSQANAAAAAATSTDWNSKGQAVYNALTGTATSSQAGLVGYLSSRASTFKSFWILNAIKVTADQQIIDAIAARSDVASVVPDETFSIPPLQPNAQGPTTTEWNLDNIQAPDVWSSFGARGDGIVVANLDTGVQFDHPALVRQYRGNNGDGTFDHNYNWFDPASVCFPTNVPCDNVAHGTHTMGTMVGDDGAGNQIGVAPAAKWIAAKGCESNFCSATSLLAAGQWLLAPTDLTGQNPRPDLRPHIVNNSWSGASGDLFFQAMVDAWVAAGIFPAFANGNSGPSCGTVTSPGDYPETYGVGAYDITNTIASFSSRGPSVLGGIKPNISAPGVNVRSSVPNNSYDIFSGTSMATPHVAGSVALLWSASAVLLGDVASTRALLDQTAIDTDDTSCGGTSDNNNTWGQGRLNILNTMNQAPIGPSGTLQGTVTVAGGGVLTGRATLHFEGTADRTTLTDATGAYHLRLPEGTYTLTVSAFGDQTQTISGINIVRDTTLTEDVALVSLPSFTLSGTVLDSTGLPVVGAQVALVGTPLPVPVTDSTGHYEFPAVPQGTYDVAASTPGSCYTPVIIPSVNVSADTIVPLTLALQGDGFGYVCRLTSTDYIPANTPTGLTGESVTTTLPLPFNFGFYNGRYSSLNISTDGWVNFIPTSTVYGNSFIPNQYDPNAAIYAFWDGIFVDGSTGTVTTDTVGTAPNRKFVIEWRNVLLFDNPAWPLSFELQLGEDGSIVSRYESTGTDPFQHGAEASVGIEDQTGTVGLQFAFLQPILSDNMAITYSLPPSGFAQGTVTDANDGTAVVGATVRARQGNTVIRQVQTDANGGYVMQVPVGSYTVDATAPSYSLETASVNVTLNAALTANFKLKTARAVLSPSTIQLTVPPNQTRTRVLTLSNTGSSSLSFTVNESGGAQQPTVSTLRLARNAVTTTTAKDTRALFAPGVVASGMTPFAAGDILKSFTPTGVGFAWGVGYTTDVWLSDLAYPYRDVEFSNNGVPTGHQFNIPWAAAFGADMAYVPSKNLLCQVNVGGDNGIYCMDPSTGNLVSAIRGTFGWTSTAQFGLAYRPDDDSFYIAGWNQGIVYHIAGLSAAVPGEVLGTCFPADGSISGLAYNPAAGVLWAATNSPTDTIYELNPNDCTVLSTLAPPQAGGFQGAGLEMDEAGNLWAVAQYPSRVFLVDSGVSAFNDVPWMSESATTGTVATGKSQKITVTINAAGLAPGLYLATLYVATSAAKQPMLRVPVSLYVPDYQQAVDSGSSSAYVDSLGDKWPVDQMYKTGNWGYVQKSKTDSATKTITGTADPKLFQTQRIDPYGYRFDNVPDGTYQVELDFAELNAKEKIGKRLFDVIVEDTLILPAHDIVYQVGTLAAEPRTFFLSVTDGEMDIRLIPRAGSDPPVINAVRITHRVDR
jgi:subtilisin family serine protease